MDEEEVTGGGAKLRTVETLIIYRNARTKAVG
jgi:hypothetical protein